MQYSWENNEGMRFENKVSGPEGTEVNSRGRVPIHRDEAHRSDEANIEDPERV